MRINTREEPVSYYTSDRKAHGIGLANMKSTVEKYQGAVDFRVNGRIFILSVMMKNERREEDGFWSDR